MKTNITILALVYFVTNSISAQDANAIMKLALQASEKVQHGYYEMTYKMKYMSDMDTATHRYRSWFKRLPKDDCFGFAFHTNLFYQGKFSGYRIYSGNELIVGDSVVTVTSVDKWKDHILNIKHNYDSYSPFTEPAEVLPNVNDIKSGKTELILLPEETLPTGMSYHILEKPELETTRPEEPMQILDTENHYWIDKKTHLILQYDQMIALSMNGDTMIQYARVTLDTFQINQPLDESKLTMSSIPSNVIIKDYTPYKEIPLLANNTPAPTWSLPSLSNDTIHLNSFKGKLVLIDFFYKSCYPCMQALPTLQALHEKYKDQGLVVIGVDPVDKKSDELAAFLQKRNVTYPVVFSDRSLPETYHVTGYPTLYLIDKNGKIIHGSSGFGQATEGHLESLITLHLKHMN